MTKAELVKEMHKATGGSFITNTQLTRFLGKKHISVARRFTHDLTPVRDRYYYINDVAQKIIDSQN